MNEDDLPRWIVDPDDPTPVFDHNKDDNPADPAVLAEIADLRSYDDGGDGTFLDRVAPRILGAIKDQRTQEILRLHYGLFGERAHSLAEIGRTLGLSRERIRQLRNDGLKELRILGKGWGFS